MYVAAPVNISNAKAMTQDAYVLPCSSEWLESIDQEQGAEIMTLATGLSCTDIRAGLSRSGVALLGAPSF